MLAKAIWMRSCCWMVAPSLMASAAFAIQARPSASSALPSQIGAE